MSRDIFSGTRRLTILSNLTTFIREMAETIQSWLKSAVVLSPVFISVT